MAARMSSDELQVNLWRHTERLKDLRRDAARRGDQRLTGSPLWERYTSEVRAFDQSLHSLFTATNGEFGEEMISRG